ncbi:MAG: hypothetical protein V1758_05625 [Pseudomonadota bacterium]
MNLSKEDKQEGLSDRVMVVDDAPLTLKTPRHILEKAGYAAHSEQQDVRGRGSCVIEQ